MDFRKTFDAIPEQFDKWRPRYCDEMFSEIIRRASLDTTKSALEIGPGTGQATQPFLKTGCDYHAIELGDNFVEFMKQKFGAHENFHIVHDDFETHDFGAQQFDLVYSGATIQWIPEQIGFPKVFQLLKSGGVLAMFMTLTDDHNRNEALNEDIQRAYHLYFRPQTRYTCKLDYENVVHYGFVDLTYLEWKRTRQFNADEYVAYLCSTQVDHLTLLKPDKDKFCHHIHEAVLKAGDQIILDDTIALYLARKP